MCAAAPAIRYNGLTDPDERVRVAAIAAVRQEALPPLARVYTAILHALEESSRAGEIWTPVLDAFAASGLWDEAATSEALRRAVLRANLPELPTPQLVAEVLIGWVATRDDPAELALVLDTFRARALRDVVAAEVRCLTGPLLDRLAHDAELLPVLTTNRAVGAHEWGVLFAGADRESRGTGADAHRRTTLAARAARHVVEQLRGTHWIAARPYCPVLAVYQPEAFVALVAHAVATWPSARGADELTDAGHWASVLRRLPATQRTAALAVYLDAVGTPASDGDSAETNHSAAVPVAA